MSLVRSSGILLHLTCLPGRYGIGDLGSEAKRFVDFLAEAGQQYWQVLPLGPTASGNSPYTTFSTFAGNPLLISPDLLKEDGLLTRDALEAAPAFPDERVDFARVTDWKMSTFRVAFASFLKQGHSKLSTEFEDFCRETAGWLGDYALFMALREDQKGAPWTRWPRPLRHREKDALAEHAGKLGQEVLFHKFLQFQFSRQWSMLKQYANSKGIRIIGDVPIYVAHNSADVWSHPQVFRLDPHTGEPTVVAGVPPDYFSATGQLWGNPLYNWDYLKATRYRWWISRIEHLLAQVDVVRIDHFRGLEAYWEVRVGETTARNGKWAKAPGQELFEALAEELQPLAEKLDGLPFIAEDLGDISQEVIDLRDHFGFPGMKVLQFAFSEGADHQFLPCNLSPNSVIYTGTHDNDTTLGWYHHGAKPHEKDFLHRYIGCESPNGIAWDMIRLALSSVAVLSVIPLQDVLSLGSEARMNMPSKPDGNWAWRFPEGTLKQDHAERLRDLVITYGR